MKSLEGVQYFESILDTVGNTPLVRLRKVAADLPCPVLAKVETFNPGGSVKDRIGMAMVEAAEREGRLKPGGTIVECTSGNTGLGLAMVAAVKGYRAAFCMPDKVSSEKVNLLKAFGAEVFLSPTAVEPEHPDSYYSVAKRISSERPGAVLMNQYHNPSNPLAHYRSTGPELWRQTNGRIWENDVFELFFKPSETSLAYYEFQINPLNAQFHTFLPSRGAGGMKRALSSSDDWKFNMKTAVVLRGTLNNWRDNDEGWSVEGRIPWKDFLRTGGAPKLGDVWRFALCRYDYSKNFEFPDLTSCAPLTVQSYHHYEDYCRLKFVGPKP